MKNKPYCSFLNGFWHGYGMFVVRWPNKRRIFECGPDQGLVRCQFALTCDTGAMMRVHFVGGQGPSWSVQECSLHLGVWILIALVNSVTYTHGKALTKTSVKWPAHVTSQTRWPRRYYRSLSADVSVVAHLSLLVARIQSLPSLYTSILDRGRVHMLFSHSGALFNVSLIGMYW